MRVAAKETYNFNVSTRAVAADGAAADGGGGGGTLNHAALRAFPGPTPRAVVGPCISSAHYEVGEEVVEGIASSGVPTAAFVHRPAGAPRPFADVGAAAIHQLRACGVTEVERISLCSFADARLHSHRRDQAASGRMAGLIGWHP